MDNHELASHTITHPQLPNASEAAGARTWLNQVGRKHPARLRGSAALGAADGICRRAHTVLRTVQHGVQACAAGKLVTAPGPATVPTCRWRACR